jgi:hypothetical protein
MSRLTTSALKRGPVFAVALQRLVSSLCHVIIVDIAKQCQTLLKVMNVPVRPVALKPENAKVRIYLDHPGGVLPITSDFLSAFANIGTFS